MVSSKSKLKGRLRKFLTSAVVLLLSYFSGGCYFRYAATTPELQNCSYAEGGGEIKEHLFIENFGWYLFYSIPICCGDDDPESFFPLTFFEDRCKEEVLHQRFEEAVKESGGTAVGVAFVNNDGVTFEVPGLSIPIVLPYVLCTRDVEISGTIIRKD